MKPTRMLSSTRRHPIIFLIGLGFGLTLYPILLMSTLGHSKPVGQFDAILVLGARVYEDGQPSDALLDRTLAACDLYKQGRAPMLILSGGTGDGSISEPQAMRQIALNQGIPDQALILDPNGLNTARSAQNAAEICQQHNWTRIVASTHFYHTPRTQIALNRVGLDADTHPASMRGHILFKLPIFMLRESVAWWSYVLRLK